ncbi:MAG TPA: hypothetical protein VEK13_01255 [Thermoplasmata archaeon]|nr:hypothetical protein [Thermoplasmata archaeon]
MPTTTIQIDVEVRDQLRARGRMGESYNDVIRRLLATTRPSVPPPRVFPSGPSPGSSKPWVPFRDRD